MASYLWRRLPFSDSPTYRQMARAAGCTERHAMRLIKALENAGIIDVMGQAGLPNQYRLTSLYLSRFGKGSVYRKPSCETVCNKPVDRNVTPLYTRKTPKIKPYANGFASQANTQNQRPMPCGVARAIQFSKSPAYAPLYRLACRVLGEDILHQAVRDVGDAERAAEWSDKPLKCRAAYFHWTLNKWLAERRLE